MRFYLTAPILVALASATSASAAQPIPVAHFHSVRLMGGGGVEIRPGSSLSVTLVEGSTALSEFEVDRDGELEIRACNGHCPHDYQLRVVITSPRAIDAAITGGGDIAFAPGFAPQHGVAAAVHGGGNIDARALRLVELTAAVNGGGKIAAGNVRALTAAVYGGGSITYTGNPQITEAIHGGGSIARVR